MVIDADTGTNKFKFWGNATTDIQTGQEIRILGSLNNGIYTVVVSLYNGTYTEVEVIEPIPVDGAGGYVEPVDDLPMGLTFTDTIGVIVEEVTEAWVLSTGGNITSSFDYGFWDIGGFDESLGTLVRLYSS